MTDTVDALRREVRAFLAGELAEGGFEPRCNAWMDAHDRAFSRRLAARGWIGMTWPTRYGGGERTALERFVVTEELLAAGAPVAAHWFADRQFGPQLLRFGTEEQRERLLPRVTAGDLCVAIGMSEPDAGSDLAAVRTSATRVDGGWRVSGAKVWTSHAHVSDVMDTLCRTEPRGEDRHAGLSQLLVDLTADGVRIAPITGLDGAAHFCEVVLDEVFVPDRDVLGEVGEGWRQVTSELAFERSGPERILSVVPLLHAAAASAAAADAGAGVAPDEAERLGRVYAGIAALRRLSLGVAGALAGGEAPDTEAALVKDLGTRFEQEQVELLRPRPGDGHEALWASAQLAAPGFTLRGGTTEVLQGIVGRGLEVA
jgi:alkylation response protein AidB-like acyl-CoA dehydrogenase